MKNNALPLIGVLKKVHINSLSYKSYLDGTRAMGESEIKISVKYEVGIDDRTFTKYFVTVELNVDGISKSLGEDNFKSECRITGYYESEERFDEVRDDVADIARVRGMYQLYPLARMEVQTYLRKVGIMVNDFEFEQIAVFEDGNIFGGSKKVAPAKKASKKKASAKKK